MDSLELRNLLYSAQLERNKGPFSIRYPKGSGMISDWNQPLTEIEIGKARLIREGSDLAVITIGHPGNFAVKAAAILESEGITFTHYDMRFLAPIDEEALHSVFRKFTRIITVEDGVLKGGLGSAVLEFMCDNGYNAEVKRMGITGYFVEHGTQEELIRECGFDTNSLVREVRKLVRAAVKS